MQNRGAKSVHFILVGALGLTVVEGRESNHIEQRQYVEPSKQTYENAMSTATVTFIGGCDPFVDDVWGGRAWSQYT
jgi:hypothetical protein